MDGLAVVPWKKFGNHRLYVNTAEGERVGWYDVISDSVVLELDERRAEFERVLVEHGVSLSPPPATSEPSGVTATIGGDQAHQAAPVVPRPLAVPELDVSGQAAGEPGAPEPERPWVDLAHNRAGQMVKEQAASLRRAAPVRSRIARVVGVHTDERAFRVGGDGEEKVAHRLAGLPDGWKVLHSVPIGSSVSDIDHVVVGPAGVFTINTKHHPDARVWVGGDTIKVNGRSVPYVRKSRFEAERASTMLKSATGIPVRAVGVIALVGVRGGLTIKAQPADGAVHVIGRKQLVQWLVRHGQVLSAEDVAAIFDGARRSTTWS